MPIVTLRPNSDQFFPYAGYGYTAVVGAGTHSAALGDSSDASYVILNANATGAQPPPSGIILGSGALFIVGMSTATLPINSVIRSVTVRARAAKDPNAAFTYSIGPGLFVSFADNYRVAEGPPFATQDNYGGAFVQTPVQQDGMVNTAIVTFIGDARAASPNTLGPVQNQPGPGGYYSGSGWTQADIDNLNLAVAYSGHNTDTVAPYVNPARILLYELYADVLYATVPSDVVTAPVGTITTENNPVVAWTYSAGADGGPQVYYRVKIFSQAQYQAAGFDGWTSLATWDSGIVNSSVSSVRSGALLANATYRAFVFVAAVTNGQTQWAVSSTTGPYSDFTIAVPGPGAPTISATPSSTAGRVAVNVTKGANPLWAYAQVQRSDDGGTTWVDVRDYTLHDMTGITTFTTFDYEAPPDTLVRYRARGLSLSGGGTAVGTWSANSNAVSWTIPFSVLTCDGAVAWLKNPLNANQNLLVRLGPGALLTKTRKINRGMFTILGRARPVAVTDVRSSVETELKILTQTALEAAQVIALFDTAQTLLLQAPTVFGWTSAYVSPGDLSEAQVIPNISRAERLFTVPIQVTDAPVGVSVPVVAAPPAPPVTQPGNVSAFASAAFGAGAANNPTATTAGGGASAYPTNANTGVPTGTAMTTIAVGAAVWRTTVDGASGFTTEVIGGNSYKVYTAKAFTGTTGYIYLDDPWVKFVNCRFTWTGQISNTLSMVQGSSALAALIANDCSFDGGTAFHNRGIWSDYGHITILRGNFQHNGNSCVEKNDRSGVGDFIVTDSYLVESKGWPPADHADLLQVGGARNVTIQHNTMWMEPYGATDGDTSYISNSCIGCWAELGNVSGNVLIDNNQMAGGGSIMYVQPKAPYVFQGTVTVSNNRFDRAHFPSLQGAGFTPTTGHGTQWFMLYPTYPSQLSWTNNKFEDGSTVTLATAVSSAS